MTRQCTLVKCWSLSPVAHNSLSHLLHKPESGSSDLAFLTLCSFNSTFNQSRRANPASSFENMPCAQPLVILQQTPAYTMSNYATRQAVFNNFLQRGNWTNPD